MGLFDTILIRVTCPTCGTEDKDVQTKALDPGLRTFRVGDLLPQETLGIKEGWIHGLGVCEKCDKTYDVKVIIRDGKITDEWEHMKGRHSVRML